MRLTADAQHASASHWESLCLTPEEDKLSWTCRNNRERLSECMRESMNVVQESRQLFEEHHEAVSERHCEVSQFRYETTHRSTQSLDARQVRDRHSRNQRTHPMKHS